MENKVAVQTQELILKVKPGTKVRVVDVDKDDVDLRDRQIHITASHSLKIAVSRVHGNDAHVSPSTITMCG